MMKYIRVIKTPSMSVCFANRDTVEGCSHSICLSCRHRADLIHLGELGANKEK